MNKFYHLYSTVLDIQDHIHHHTFHLCDDRLFHSNNVHNYCYSSRQNILHCKLWKKNHHMHVIFIGKNALLSLKNELIFFKKRYSVVWKKISQNNLRACQKLSATTMIDLNFYSFYFKNCGSSQVRITPFLFATRTTRITFLFCTCIKRE